MDYCSSCRRHLNGALTCPGCGAYAPDIAPPAHIYARTGAAAAALDEAPTPHDAGLHEEPAAGATDPGLPSEDVTDAPVTTEGRAARRRQRARWKKNQRKAVVATAVALVGGGLTVSAMNQQTSAKTQAATSPDNRSMGMSELPTSDDGLPASTPGTPRQASTTAPSTTLASHRRTSTTAGSSAHTDSAASPAPTTASRSQSRTTPSTSGAAGVDSGGTTGTTGTTGSTGTSTEQSTSSSTDTGSSADTGSSTNTGTSTGTSSDGSQTTPSSSATDPSGLCVLNLLCIS